MQSNIDEDLRLLRKPAVMEKTGLPHASLYDAMNNLGFPRPIKIGPIAVAWVEHEVNAWIVSQMAKRDGKAA